MSYNEKTTPLFSSCSLLVLFLLSSSLRFGRKLASSAVQVVSGLPPSTCCFASLHALSLSGVLDRRCQARRMRHTVRRGATQFSGQSVSV